MASFLDTIVQLEKLTTEEHSALTHLVAGARTVQIGKGQDLYEEIGPGEWLVHVDNGMLRQFVVNEQGQEKILHLFCDGHIFDRCSASAGNANMLFEVTALEDSKVTIFQLGEVNTVSLQYPVFMKIAFAINNQLIQTHAEHATLLMTYTPDERYRYMMTNRPELLQRLSVTHLAQYLDVSRETLSRIRSRMLESAL